MSGVRDGPGEGTWSVFAEKVVAERNSLRVERDALAADRKATQWANEGLRARVAALEAQVARLKRRSERHGKAGKKP
jgi:uncharacterized protein YceH (UPF0502 family)